MTDDKIICWYCRTEQNVNANFCSKCGALINKNLTQTAPPPSQPLIKEPKTIYERAIYLFIIQSVMLVLSIITGRFQWTSFSTIDSAILLVAIAITSLVFVDINEKRREKWLFGGIVLFLAGVIMMALTLMFS